MVSGLPLTKGGRRGASPTALVCQPQLQTGAAVLSEKALLRSNRKASDPWDCRKAIWSPSGKWWPLQFLQVWGKTPILKICPSGLLCGSDTNEMKILSHRRNPFHMTGGEGFVAVGFGFWCLEDKRKRKNMLALPSFHTKPEIQNQRAGSWVSGHPSAWWYFHKKIFPKPQGDPM